MNNAAQTPTPYTTYPNLLNLPDYRNVSEGDRIGKRVITNVVRQTEDFVVVILDDETLAWAQQARGHDSLSKYYRYTGEADRMKTMAVQFLPSSQRRHYLRLLANAIVSATHNQYERAESELAEAKTYFEERSLERSRLWYTVGAASALTVVAALTLTVWTFRSEVERCWGVEFLHGVLMFFAGLCGAFVSSSMRPRPGQPTAGVAQHVYDGIVRLFVGGCAAVFCLMAVKGKLLFSQLANDSELLLGALGFVAGTSECFVKSLVSGVERSAATGTVGVGIVIGSESESSGDKRTPE